MPSGSPAIRLFLRAGPLALGLPAPALAEVLDKEPGPVGLLLITAVAVLPGLVLARLSLWTLLVTWPLCAVLISFGLMQEFYEAALIREGGWPVAITWHLAALAAATWPLLPLLRRRRAGMP